MKRLISAVAMLVVAACSQAPPTLRPYGADLPPLTANGLPGSYELCARNAAVKTAAMYDVYYPCRREIAFYLAQMGDKTQQEKAVMADEMDKLAMDYAQKQAEAFHGADAVRRASAPVDPPPHPIPPNDGIGTPVIIEQHYEPREKRS
jgi:hypothetical protein